MRELKTNIPEDTNLKEKIVNLQQKLNLLEFIQPKLPTVYFPQNNFTSTSLNVDGCYFYQVLSLKQIENVIFSENKIHRLIAQLLFI